MLKLIEQFKNFSLAVEGLLPNHSKSSKNLSKRKYDETLLTKLMSSLSFQQIKFSNGETWNESDTIIFAAIKPKKKPK